MQRISRRLKKYTESRHGPRCKSQNGLVLRSIRLVKEKPKRALVAYFDDLMPNIENEQASAGEIRTGAYSPPRFSAPALKSPRCCGRTRPLISIGQQDRRAKPLRRIFCSKMPPAHCHGQPQRCLPYLLNRQPTRRRAAFPACCILCPTLGAGAFYKLFITPAQAVGAAAFWGNNANVYS